MSDLLVEMYIVHPGVIKFSPSELCSMVLFQSRAIALKKVRWISSAFFNRQNIAVSDGGDISFLI